MIFLQKRATAGTNLIALWGFDTRDYAHPASTADFVGTIAPFELDSSPFGGDTNYMFGGYDGAATDWPTLLGSIASEDFSPVLVVAWSDRVAGDTDYAVADMVGVQPPSDQKDPSYRGIISMTASDTFDASFTMEHRSTGSPVIRVGTYTYPSTPTSGIAFLWSDPAAGTAGLYVNNAAGTYSSGALPDASYMTDWGSQADSGAIDPNLATGFNEILSVEDEVTPTPANQQWHVAGFALCHGVIGDVAAETAHWADFFGVTVS